MKSFRFISLISLILSSQSFSYTLRVVEELKNQLSTQPVAVIFGAPGSGKTEQMELGLAGQSYHVFDLRSKFLEQYAQEQNITEPSELAAVKKKYRQLKDKELAWISNQKSTIINNLHGITDTIIVFDEFDLGGTFQSGTPELQSAKVVLDIASQIKNKKIILIIHDEALGSPELMHAIENQFGIGPQKIIRTGYLSTNEQHYLLRMTNLTREQKIQYRAWTRGNPSGYLPIITSLAKNDPIKVTFEELKEKAITNAKKVYNVAKITNPNAVGAIKKLVNKQATLKSFSPEMKESMINTGLLGLKLVGTAKVKVYLLPPLIQKVVAADQ